MLLIKMRIKKLSFLIFLVVLAMISSTTLAEENEEEKNTLSLTQEAVTQTG
jgi:hypothetical protein